ncbi:peptide chain release factor 2 [candidate division KSB1 bacterium]|nr:peptide chain release factor 2 [candidate division KSB1 bacterium]
MFEEIKESIIDLNRKMNDLRGYLEIDQKIEKIKDLESTTLNENFWQDQEKAQQTMKQITMNKDVVDQWEKLNNRLSDLNILVDMAVEEGEESALQDFESELSSLQKEIKALEFKRMLGLPDDTRNALLTIHPGAGGTESQDWAQMLLRMYLRWIERRGFQSNILDSQSGDEAGIKSATIEVIGDYAYGYLKAEIGVHRLVRISPFDSNSRRHTSFASVFVYPEVDNEVEVVINPSDLKVDTYRASGAGGQHVNKTSSAVRITHIPTGLVVQCQSERSQHMNRANALKILMSRLYQMKQEEEREKIDKLEKSKKDIAWGSQIRSYIFHPYNMVKDHRTKVETSNTQAVMDGDLDEFIYQYLLTSE